MLENITDFPVPENRDEIDIWKSKRLPMLAISNVNSPMLFYRSETLAISTIPKSSWNADKVRNATDRDWLSILSFAGMFSRLALNDAECIFC